MSYERWKEIPNYRNSRPWHWGFCCFERRLHLPDAGTQMPPNGNPDAVRERSGIIECSLSGWEVTIEDVRINRRPCAPHIRFAMGRLMGGEKCVAGEEQFAAQACPMARFC